MKDSTQNALAWIAATCIVTSLVLLFVWIVMVNR